MTETINWQYLKYFETVAHEEHMTRAANALNITQSALSKSIDNLEKDLGFPLFERQGRNIKLTKYGQIFANRVTKATREIEESVITIRNLLSPEKGVISFSSIFSMGAEFMPHIIRQFSDLHPGIKLNYYQESTTNILDHLLLGKIEFGFSGEFNLTKYPMIEREPVQIEELVVIVPKNHPLADRKSISFEEIKDEIFVGYTENTGIIHSLTRSLGVPLSAFNVKYSANEDNTVAGLVRAGLGIGFIADNPAIFVDGLNVLHIKEPRVTRTLYMCWKRDIYMTPAAKLFKYFVLSNIALNPPTS